MSTEHGQHKHDEHGHAQHGAGREHHGHEGHGENTHAGHHDGHPDHGEHEHDSHHTGHDHSGHGHGGHSGHDHSSHVAQYRRLFWIMLALSIPVVAFNSMFAELIGYSLPDAEWVRWVSPIIGTVMYFWGGWPFLKGAADEIRGRQPGMMLLIGLAITVAFFASWGSSLGMLDHSLNFWWELALLIVIMLLGHWIEMRSLAQTSSALESLAALLPDEAEKVVGDETVTVTPDELEVGDVIILSLIHI